MGQTTRPNSHDERDACIAAAAPLTGSDPSDPLLAHLIEEWAPARDTYLDAREAHLAAMAADAARSKAVREADAAFDEGLGRWARSVVDDKNRPRTREVSEMLGGVRPGALTAKGYREEVTRARTLLGHVRLRPELAGDPDDLAALTAAVDRLETAVDASESAARERKAAVAVLDEASRAFDRAWGRLIRGLALADPERAKVVAPRFRRPGRARPAQAEGERKSASCGPEQAGDAAVAPELAEAEPEESDVAWP